MMTRDEEGELSFSLPNAAVISLAETRIDGIMHRRKG